MIGCIFIQFAYGRPNYRYKHIIKLSRYIFIGVMDNYTYTIIKKNKYAMQHVS